MNLNCPIDGTTLQIAERQGVEIDYCPKCRGVWLDRGELDKLIERADVQAPSRYEQEERQVDPRDKKKKRGSFLGDMFDGFGD